MKPTSPKSISSLLSVQSNGRDLAWLRDMLQIAVELEFSTVPPYLCALWSIMDDDGSSGSDLSVYLRVLGVVREEMSHMGLAANLLNTIGGTPKINTAEAVPTFPGPLPGGVRPSVRLSLGKLSLKLVTDVFMQVEFPENGPVEFHCGRTYPTIGAFYSAILDCFLQLGSDCIVGDRQIEYQNGQIDIYPVRNLADVEQAVTIIKEQGEGTTTEPFSSSGETAHYYRFGEIYHQREIESDGTGGWEYSGAAVPFPGIFPVVEVPPRGYRTARSIEFDQVYMAMLDDLQSAWETGDSSHVDSSVNRMREMKPIARDLMTTPLPNGGGNYCPDFRSL